VFIFNPKQLERRIPVVLVLGETLSARRPRLDSKENRLCIRSSFLKKFELEFIVDARVRFVGDYSLVGY
jgi:hypothetical protein